jgi:tRNA(adenine34) deaminase
VAKKRAARKKTAKPKSKKSADKSAGPSPSRRKATKKKTTNKKKPAKRWVRKVTTDSTHPPPGTFKQDAETIAETMASKKVSPKGIGSGVRMIQYYINRGGKNLSKTRKQELEKAKRILQRKEK